MSHERITANLPSRDFDSTATFYGLLGFEVRFRSAEWMILRSGPLEIEFFPMSVDPKDSWFSACIRVDDLDSLYEKYSSVVLPRDPSSVPRLTAPTVIGGRRMFALVDIDGSLLRCMENVPVT
jgi:hypothetical protein